MQSEITFVGIAAQSADYLEGKAYHVPIDTASARRILVLLALIKSMKLWEIIDRCDVYIYDGYRAPANPVFEELQDDDGVMWEIQITDIPEPTQKKIRRYRLLRDNPPAWQSDAEKNRADKEFDKLSNDDNVIFYDSHFRIFDETEAEAWKDAPNLIETEMDMVIIDCNGFFFRAFDPHSDEKYSTEQFTFDKLNAVLPPEEHWKKDAE
jgi:hypothetical protein